MTRCVTNRLGVAILVLTVTLVGAGCGEDNTGGGPFPQQFADEVYPGARSTIEGTTVVDANGCVLVATGGARYLAVWPAGSTWDGRRVATPQGARFADGDPIQAIGTFVAVSALPGVPDGYWGHQLEFCAPEATEVVVIDSATS